MRFRARVEVRFEVGSLDQAQAAAHKIESAAVDSVGPALVPGPEGGLSRTDLEPLDEDARAAFAEEDLGPGISSMRSEYWVPDSDSS